MDQDARATMNASRSSRHTERPQPAAGAVPYLRVVDGDGYHEWESVYRDNVERLYRLMYARVGNRADAEDLTAETFSAALRPLRLPSSKGEVRAYLLQTAKTVLAGHWRRRLGQPVTSIDPLADLPLLSSDQLTGHGVRSGQRRTGTDRQDIGGPSRAISTNPRTPLPGSLLDQGSRQGDAGLRQQRQGAPTSGAAHGSPAGR